MASELNGRLVTFEETRDSKKRKRTDEMQKQVTKKKRSAEDGEEQRKKRLTNPSSPLVTSWDNKKGEKNIGRGSNTKTAEPGVESKKRKASDDGGAPKKKIIITLHNDSQSTSTSTNSPSNPKVEEDVSVVENNVDYDFGSVSVEEENIFEMASSANTSKTEFDNKYSRMKPLGSGGFGSVYGGFRKSDFLPVAIKYIPGHMVHCERVKCNGTVRIISTEVAFMLKTGGLPGSKGHSAAVSLLDWYILDKELVLVMEWPVSSEDLFSFLQSRQKIEEHEAKMIMSQLVDAAIDLHAKGVFHRDIKPSNILCQAESDRLKMRVIDFGCGSFSSERPFTSFSGTRIYAPPEWFDHQKYCARPTTVWQLGAVFYMLLHKNSFTTRKYIEQEIEINKDLSTETKILLHMCLARDPEDRATLEELQHHPALRRPNNSTTQDHLQE